jgi:hypothetical protein
MKIFYFIFLIAFYSNSIKSQTVIVSGQCMTGSIVLNPIGNVDGKPAYESTGTVDGNAGVQVDVYWMPAPDNLWVLAFDGQPYFQNSCNTAIPWNTDNPACPWTAVTGQTCTGASPLAINGLGTLAVTLAGFTARIDNKQVILNWKTASETNNKGFEIRRSPDGINWNNIGFVNGNMNSAIERSYQFSDLDPLAGENFYRLRQVDLDGKYLYSIVASVDFIKSGFYSISGNPGNNIYRLNIETTAEKVELSIFDAGGKMVMIKTTGAGVQTIDISKFSSGVYLLRVRKGIDMFTEKLVKF